MEKRGAGLCQDDVTLTEEKDPKDGVEFRAECEDRRPISLLFLYVASILSASPIGRRPRARDEKLQENCYA